MRSNQALTVAASGVQVTAGASSAVVAIPNDAQGVRARRVRLLATGTLYVRPGFSGTTCTASDILLGPNEAVVLEVKAFTHIAYLQEAAAPKLNITPIEV